MTYDVTNWFWIVGGDSSKFWSSASAGWVQANSPAYQTFLAQGGGATPIASLDELAQVFAAQYPGGMLLVYANARQWAKVIGGYATTIGEQQIVFPTTPESMSLISGKAQRLQQPNPPTFINWQVGPTSFIDIAAADFTTLATEIADFVQATFDTLKTVFAQIEAGTITTRAEIDAAFPL